MSRLSRATPFLVFGILIFGGCQDEALFPTEPEARDDSPALTKPSPYSLPGGDRARKATDHLIGEEVSGFGGYRHDEEGNLVAYLRDGALPA